MLLVTLCKAIFHNPHFLNKLKSIFLDVKNAENDILSKFKSMKIYFNKHGTGMFGRIQEL
jgi:hypothetical protein